MSPERMPSWTMPRRPAWAERLDELEFWEPCGADFVQPGEPELLAELRVLQRLREVVLGADGEADVPVVIQERLRISPSGPMAARTSPFRDVWFRTPRGEQTMRPASEVLVAVDGVGDLLVGAMDEWESYAAC